MIPLILAGAAAILLAGCSKDKDKEKKEAIKLAKPPTQEPFRDLRQTTDIAFLSVSQNQLWHDTNSDGKQVPQEKITLLGTESPLDAAKRFILKNPAVKPACNPWKAVLLPGSVKLIFDHPEKTRIARRLDADIAALGKMSQRPPYFDGLLNDLRLIREELPHVRFFYAKAGEVPPGFIGIYDDMAGEMVVTRGAPMSLMVHEMDHRITAHRRVEPYSTP